MKLDNNTLEYFKAINDGCNTIEFTYDKKNSLYIPLFSAYIEQCIAIHVLDKEELTSSAFALARPMVESYSRAMWVKYCLDEAKIEEGCEQLHFPKKLEFLLSSVGDAGVDGDRFHDFKPAIEPIMSNMHDFTHGGVQSIARQYGNDGHLSSPRSREERDELLKLAILTSSLSYENLTL
ncbi:hypothetical protein [Shewanella sp. 10N.286.52.B9]|uniref:DUF6988 family protein n=1 Tax=Shewanella sp. 10N.286.52.B9 TaxID=1880837 RepID=UPI0018E47D9F|nr:hypothetical protein [Shewanella sp. 10N.286.52.B9]